MPYDVIEPETSSGGYDVIEPEQPESPKIPQLNIDLAALSRDNGAFQPSQFGSGASAFDPGSNGDLGAALRLPLDAIGAGVGALSEHVIEPVVHKLNEYNPLVVGLKGMGVDVQPKEGESVIPESWTPLANEKGVIPSLTRTLRAFTTEGQLATLPLALTKPVQAMYAAGAVSGVPQQIQNVRDAAPGAETRDAATDLITNLTLAGVMGKGLMRGEAPSPKIQVTPREFRPSAEPLTMDRLNAEPVIETQALDPATGSPFSATESLANRLETPQLSGSKPVVKDARAPEATEAKAEVTHILDETGGNQPMAVVPEISQFGNDFNSAKRISTEGAVKAGMAAKTVADLDSLAKLRTDITAGREAFQKALAAETDKAKRDTMFNEMYAKNPQLPREAIEAATNTGSHVEGEGGTKYGERPLDWRNNPEVAGWLRKNGEKLGIELPDELKGTNEKAKTTQEEVLDESVETQALDPATGSPLSATDSLASRLETPNQAGAVADLKAPVMEPVGMGAAAAGEVTPSPKTATSIKNETVDAERQARGLPPAVQPVKRAFGKVWDEAMAEIDRDPGSVDRLVNELRDKPRSLTDKEDATLLHRQIDLQNEYGKATRDLAQAFDDGRMDAVTQEQARVEALSDHLLDLYNINKKVGTETGRGLNARKMMAMEDFTLAKMELEKRAANEGRPLTPKERSELVSANKKIEETQKKFDEYVAKTDRQLAERDMQAALDEMQKDIKSSKPKFPKAEDIESQKQKIKLRLDEGERSDISGMVNKLARMFVEQGIKLRDPLIDAVHGVLKEIDPEFTRRETMDAISGYGDFKQLTKDEISLKVRDLKGQMQQVAKLEDMQANKPPLKTGIERRIPSTEESRLIRLVNEAKNQFQIPITDPNTQLKSSLDTLKARLKNQISQWEDRLQRGDFSKKPKRVIQMDAEANKLHFENAQAKAKWHEALMKDRIARRTKLQRVGAATMESANLVRAVKTSFDLSAVLRQGAFIAFGHPIRAAKSFPAMFKALASEAGQHAVDREITQRKNYPLMTRSKLYLSEHGQKLSQMEEAYMSRWADKIPGVAASQRAYTTYLNKLRADSFDAMHGTLTRRVGEATPEQLNAISNFINVATGRGNLGMKENALVGLNTVFFAPRFVASRIQLAIGQPLWRGDIHTRRMVAEEYARFLAGLGVVYVLAESAGADVETDPRSADFGKLRFGNTRVDPLAGVAQVTTLGSRLGSGETKRLSGEIVPIRGPDVPFGSGNSADVMARFLRTKLAPVPGAIVNVLSGKDVVGQPVTATSTAKDLALPMSFDDIYRAMIEQGVPKGTALGILSTFGMSLQTHEDKK